MSRTKSRLAPRLEVSGFHERRNIMANILKRIYRIFNGTDWDIVHLETDSEQVKHDTTTVKAKLDALKSGALATVVNNLTTTATNTVLDGRQGKALDDKIKALNSALAGWKFVETATTGDNGGTSLSMQNKLAAENMYIIFVRHLGADNVYPPYALLLFMRSENYNYTSLGEIVDFDSTSVIDGKLTIKYKSKQWARMWIYKIS